MVRFDSVGQPSLSLKVFANSRVRVQPAIFKGVGGSLGGLVGAKSRRIDTLLQE